jgi:hypothetical protein
MCKFLDKSPNTSKKNNCARFEEYQLKGVGGVDYTK